MSNPDYRDMPDAQLELRADVCAQLADEAAAMGLTDAQHGALQEIDQVRTELQQRSTSH
jgi:hypothetical protein